MIVPGVISSLHFSRILIYSEYEFISGTSIMWSMFRNFCTSLSLLGPTKILFLSVCLIVFRSSYFSVVMVFCSNISKSVNVNFGLCFSIRSSRNLRMLSLDVHSPM